jgi:hypothetical protein
VSAFDLFIDSYWVGFGLIVVLSVPWIVFQPHGGRAWQHSRALRRFLNEKSPELARAAYHELRAVAQAHPRETGLKYWWLAGALDLLYDWIHARRWVRDRTVPLDEDEAALALQIFNDVRALVRGPRRARNVYSRSALVLSALVSLWRKVGDRDRAWAAYTELWGLQHRSKACAKTFRTSAYLDGPSITPPT